MLRILLADHNFLACAGMRALLDDIEDLELLDTTNDSFNLTKLCHQSKPNVLVINIGLPDLELNEVVVNLRAECPETNLLLRLDLCDLEDINIQALLKNGVACILKDEPMEILVDAIRTIGHGRMWLSQVLLTYLAQQSIRQNAPAIVKGLPDALVFGSLLIDARRRYVSYQQQEIYLSKLEFDLLLYLTQHVNKACSYDELLDNVWGYEDEGDAHLVQLTVHRIRDKVRRCCGLNIALPIRTLRGIGLCFEWNETTKMMLR